MTLLGSWRNEIKKWLGSTKLIPLVAVGTKDNVVTTCTNFVQGKYRVLMISYESFRVQCGILNGHCDLLIFDEGHRLKNMNIKTFQAISKFQCQKRIILTGTPLQNSMEEFYSCVSFVNPHVFESLQKFKNIFAEPIMKALKSDATPVEVERAQERSKQLTEIISRFILRRKADILQKLLPPKTEYQIFLRLTDLQKQIYQKIIKAKKNKWDFESDGDGDILGILTVMRKLLNHPTLGKNGGTIRALLSLSPQSEGSRCAYPPPPPKKKKLDQSQRKRLRKRKSTVWKIHQRQTNE